MKNSSRITPLFMTLIPIVVVVVWFSASPIRANAQGTQGQNAVFNSSGNYSQCAGSSAFIDAFITQGTNDDFLQVLGRRVRSAPALSLRFFRKRQTG